MKISPLETLIMNEILSDPLLEPIETPAIDKWPPEEEIAIQETRRLLAPDKFWLLPILEQSS